jgi:rubrerythrin
MAIEKLCEENQELANELKALTFEYNVQRDDNQWYANRIEDLEDCLYEISENPENYSRRTEEDYREELESYLDLLQEGEDILTDMYARKSELEEAICKNMVWIRNIASGTTNY